MMRMEVVAVRGRRAGCRVRPMMEEGRRTEQSSRARKLLWRIRAQNAVNIGSCHIDDWAHERHRRLLLSILAEFRRTPSSASKTQTSSPMHNGASAALRSPSRRTVVQVLWLGSRPGPQHSRSLVFGTDDPRYWVDKSEQHEQSTMTSSDTQLTPRSNARRRFSSIHPATSANSCNLSSR